MLINLHPDNPQPRLIAQVADLIRHNGTVIAPTLAGYALIGDLNSKTASDKISQFANLNLNKDCFTVFVRDFSQLGQCAQINNEQFRLMKSAQVGAYGFVLPATKTVPNRIVNKHKACAFRFFGQAIGNALLDELKTPLIGCAVMVNDELLTDPYDMNEQFQHTIDAVIDGGWCGTQTVTLVSLMDGTEILQTGMGSSEIF